MRRISSIRAAIRTLLLLAGAVAAVDLPPVASAQPPGRDMGGRDRSYDKRNQRQGRAAGRLVSAVRQPGSEDRFSTVTIESSPGHQQELIVDEQTVLDVMGTDLTPVMVAALFQPGVDVTANWEEARDPRTGGRVGYRALRVMIQTQWIEGTLKSVTKDGISGEALPKQPRMRRSRADPPPITVQGRRSPADAPPPPPRGPDAPPPKPERVRFDWTRGLTRITLEGAAGKESDLIEAAKTGAPLAFEAAVVMGTRPMLAELHVRKTDANYGTKKPPRVSKFRG